MTGRLTTPFTATTTADEGVDFTAGRCTSSTATRA